MDAAPGRKATLDSLVKNTMLMSLFPVKLVKLLLFFFLTSLYFATLGFHCVILFPSVTPKNGYVCDKMSLSLNIDVIVCRQWMKFNFLGFILNELCL